MLGAAVVPRAETPRTKPGPILVSTAVTSVGMGVFGATSFLYYTRVVRVPATTMGAVLTVVGLAAIAVSLCLGRYLDGKDMVKVNVGLLAAQAAGVLGVAAAGFAAPLAVAVGVVTVFTKLVVAARRALLVRAAAGDDRRVLRARTRAVTNMGAGLGSAAAAAACSIDTAAAYRAALAVTAGLYLLGALPLMRTRIAPAAGAAAPPAESARTVFGDRRYLVVAAAGGLLSVYLQFIQVGLPVWISQSPVRAVWLVSAALCVNTAVVAAAQVPLARRITTVAQASRATASAGAGIAASAVLVAVAGALAGPAVCAVVVAAALVYSVAEAVQACAAWELSCALAPEDRPMEYQTVFTSAVTVGTVLGPWLITWSLTAAGNLGWLILAAVVAAPAASHLAFRNYT